ncbi:MAG: hypothetical protein HY678_11465 [Chloroflexi bacterium]|nr:hypothetical protein [Chloroflexota bacterium]
MKKIATMAEAYYVPISPHNAQGTGQILAGAHVCMTVPNFYRLEHAPIAVPVYNRYLREPIEFKGNYLRLSDRPGLGHELNMDNVMSDLHPAWRGRMPPAARAGKRSARSIPR